MTEGFAREYLQQAREILGRVDPVEVARFVEVIFEAWQRDATVYVCGNGGSASTAQHLACDLFKCTVVGDKRRLRVMSLNDNTPLVSALINDDGWDQVYLGQLTTWWRSGDVVLAISVHGGVGRDKAGAWSQNLLRAIEFANQHDGQSLGLVGFDGGAMRETCTVSLLLPADTTPHVEGLHVVLHHLVTAAVRERIAAAVSTSPAAGGEELQA